MRVVFCGTSAGGPSLNSERAGASIFVQSGNGGVLLDCGQWSLERFARAGFQVADIDAVFLSHTHNDHVLGLQELLVRRTFRGAGGPLPVYGPSGTAELVDHMNEIVELLMADRLTFEGTANAVEEVVVGAELSAAGFTVTSTLAEHSPTRECFGWKVVADDVTVVYSGDTAASPETMVPFAQGSDLLIHDAFTHHALEAFVREHSLSPELLERYSQIHGKAEDVGAIARDAAVSRLVLTSILHAEDEDHLIAEAAQRYDGSITVAYDGLTLEL